MIKIFCAVVLNSDMPFKFGRFRICFYLVQCLVMHCLPACSSMLYASSLINLFSDLSPKAGFFQLLAKFTSCMKQRWDLMIVQMERYCSSSTTWPNSSPES